MGGLLDLVDTSFVQRQEHTGGQVRYSLLETICRYAPKN